MAIKQESGPAPPGQAMRPVQAIRLLALAVVALLLAAHGGLYVWEARKLEQQIAPRLAFPALEKELWSFRRDTGRWPASLAEFAVLKRPWALDKDGQSRVRQCAGQPCSGFQGQSYLYLYRVVSPQVVAVWALPSLPDIAPPFMLDPEQSPMFRWGRRLWDAHTVEEQIAGYRAASPTLFAVCVAAGPPACRRWQGRPGVTFTPSQAMALFEPTSLDLANLGLVEVVPAQEKAAGKK